MLLGLQHGMAASAVDSTLHSPVTNPPLPTIMYAYANWVVGVSCRFLSVSLGLLILAEVFLSVSSGKAQLTGPLPTDNYDYFFTF